MIILNQLSMAYGQQLLFYDVNLKLNPGQCYGLVGANGAGKSTFFRLLTGEEEASSGDISIPKDASVGWLKQDQFRYEQHAILDVVIQGNEELWQAMQQKEDFLHQTTEWDEAACDQLAALEDIIMHHDGYAAHAHAAMLLEGLGITQAYHQQTLSTFSGGYKLRVLLAKLLFQRPDILLLDEPTNHLDIVSIRWLENFLKHHFKGLVVFISHDIDFINNLSNSILDLDYGEIRAYPAPYHKFLRNKALIEEQKALEVKSKQEKIAKLQQFVDRFGAKASKAKQARSRMKMIERIDIPDVTKSSRVAPAFAFKPQRPSGKETLKVSNLSKQYKDKILFIDFNLTLKRGEKVAILGINGAGKSTLIKTVVGQVKADEGEIQWGHAVQTGYMSQDHHDQLKQSEKVLAWCASQGITATEQNIRKTLGQLLFKQEDAYKDVLSLSGGEAARLLLAVQMLAKPNVLLLDEPTNHMDIETIESLGLALKRYEGTLLVVSHNRHFVSAFANRILYFTATQEIIDFKGTYQEFEQQVLAMQDPLT